MRGYLLLMMMTVTLQSQEYYFIRDGQGYRMVQKYISEPIGDPVDERPVWRRLLSSLRPWTSTSPGTRFHYDMLADHVFVVEGGVAIGIQGKVDF